MGPRRAPSTQHTGLGFANSGAVPVLPQSSALSSGEMGRCPLLVSSCVTGSRDAVLAGWDHLVTVVRVEGNSSVILASH